MKLLPSPLNELLNLDLVEAANGQATVRMPFSRTYLQEANIVHGGIISVVADTAAVYTVLPTVSDPRQVTGIEFKINFLSPAVAAGGEITARATLVKRGKRVAVCDTEVWQGPTFIAKGMFTYLVKEQ